MSNSTTSFRASVVLVLEEIKNISVLHCSTTKQLEFALHVCLVAYGVRTGYLVDAVCPPNPADTFGTLLLALRRKTVMFKDVVFWHHTPTAQSFLVHVLLLQDKITVLLGGARQQCVFVKLDKCPSVSSDLLDALRDALHGMRSAMAESPDARVLSLSELFAQDILIPLAAVAIDYPVAYVPARSTQTSFLQGEPLDIYTVSFKWAIGNTSNDTLGREHVLLKFSCPQILASEDAELSSSRMMAKLRVKFVPALERIGAFVVVTHRTETLERVAL